MTQVVSTGYLKEIMHDAHNRSMELVAGLNPEQLMGPRLQIVNPLRWEIGHVASFYEKFILRDLYGYAPIHPTGDQLYDSIAVHHETRWDLPLLGMSDTLKYVQDVLDQCLSRLRPGMASEQESYIYQFATFHQDMHTEAYTYTRQTLAYPMPDFCNAKRSSAAGPSCKPGRALAGLRGCCRFAGWRQRLWLSPNDGQHLGMDRQCFFALPGVFPGCLHGVFAANVPLDQSLEGWCVGDPQSHANRPPPELFCC